MLKREPRNDEGPSRNAPCASALGRDAGSQGRMTEVQPAVPAFTDSVLMTAQRQEIRRLGTGPGRDETASRGQAASQLPAASTVDGSARMTMQRRAMQALGTGPRDAGTQPVQFVKIQPYGKKLADYSSPGTFARMQDLGDATLPEGKPVVRPGDELPRLEKRELRRWSKRFKTRKAENEARSQDQQPASSDLPPSRHDLRTTTSQVPSVAPDETRLRRDQSPSRHPRPSIQQDPPKISLDQDRSSGDRRSGRQVKSSKRQQPPKSAYVPSTASSDRQPGRQLEESKWQDPPKSNRNPSTSSSHRQPGRQFEPSKWQDPPKSNRNPSTPSSHRQPGRQLESSTRQDPPKPSLDQTPLPGDQPAEPSGLSTAKSDPPVKSTYVPPHLRNRQTALPGQDQQAAPRGQEAVDIERVYEGDKRKMHSYAVIFGFDDEDDEPRVLLARKSLINEYHTEDGVRVPQDVEMRAPGQLGLPGGSSREFHLHRDAEHNLDIPSLAMASGADEALAETGINVRSDAFSPLGYAYENAARTKKNFKFEKNARTHAFFQYKGKLSELALRANQLLANKGAADDEVSSVVVARLSEAMLLMEASETNARDQAKQLDGEDAEKRFIGDGVDWHKAPLSALGEARKQIPRPEKLESNKAPDALKALGLSAQPDSDKPPLAEIGDEAKQEDLAKTTSNESTAPVKKALESSLAAAAEQIQDLTSKLPPTDQDTSSTTD